MSIFNFLLPAINVREIEALQEAPMEFLLFLFLLLPLERLGDMFSGRIELIAHDSS